MLPRSASSAHVGGLRRLSPVIVGGTRYRATRRSEREAASAGLALATARSAYTDVMSQQIRSVETLPKLTPFCPRFHHAVELIGRRWSGAIIRAMLSGATRFSDITAAIPGLSDRLLSERLKELEAEGVLKRTVYPEIPVRIEYRLTEKGQALAPIVQSLSDWAEEWLADIDVGEYQHRD